MRFWRMVKTKCELLGIRYGGYIPERIRLRIYNWLYPPGAPKPMQLVMDIVGSCNLRCPSCPVGNMGPVNPTGLMSKELFQRIVDRAFDEFGVRAVALFNWTEPLLHPDLPEFIRIIKRKGMYCMLSSNLNVMHNIDEVLKAKPDWFRISLSGFTQGVYGRTHAHGQIERVKMNMRQLSDARKRVGSHKTLIHVFYHKYRHNIHEIAPMKQLTEELGFVWEETWANYAPLEKALMLVEGSLPTSERRFVENELALPMLEAIEAAKAVRNFSRCTLLEDQIVVNVRGELALCCAVYDLSNPLHKLGHFLEMTAEDIKKAKQRHPTCERCGKHSLFVYGTFYDVPGLSQTYDRLAEENIRKQRTTKSNLDLPIIQSSDGLNSEVLVRTTNCESHGKHECH